MKQPCAAFVGTVRRLFRTRKNRRVQRLFEDECAKFPHLNGSAKTAAALSSLQLRAAKGMVDHFRRCDQKGEGLAIGDNSTIMNGRDRHPMFQEAIDAYTNTFYNERQRLIADDAVIPNLEHVPERKYERNGSRISCFEIKSVTGSATHPVHNYADTPIFTIQLANEDHAKALMNDLYYGEYTGA